MSEAERVTKELVPDDDIINAFKNTDFEEADEWHKKTFKGSCDLNSDNERVYKTIQLALRIADRLKDIDTDRLSKICDDIYKGGIHRHDMDYAEDCLENLLCAIKECEDEISTD